MIDALLRHPEWEYDLWRDTPMSAPTLVRLPDGSDVNGSDVTCEGCGNALADHSCGGSGGGSVTYTSPTYVRRSGPRAPASAAPTCAHCQGRLHQNLKGINVDFECQAIQYAMDQGLISNPMDRIPAHLATPQGLIDIGTWALSLATPISYGKMVSAAGGAGTYAGLKPKTGRKKKTAPAAAGSRIEDMAEGEDIVTTAEVTENGTAQPKRGRKSRGSKGPKVSKLTSNEDDTTTVEMVDLETAVAEAEADLASTSTEVEVNETPVQNDVSEAEAARQARAARRAEQKARLARL